METSLILIVIASVIISIIWYRFRHRCPNCHSWNNLKQIYKEHDRTETRYRTVTRTETHRDRNGKIIRTKDKQVDVPYNVVYNRITYQCKNINCNEKVQLTLREGKYLQETGVVFLVCAVLLFAAFNSDKIKSHNKVNVSNSNNLTDTSKNYPNNTFTTPVESTSVNKENNNTSNKSVKENRSENIEVTTTGSDNLEKSGNNETNVNENSLELAPMKKAVNQKTQITRNSDENIKRKLALDMLDRGKDIDEIADSTFLSKATVRKIRRNNKKE